MSETEIIVSYPDHLDEPRLDIIAEDVCPFELLEDVLSVVLDSLVANLVDLRGLRSWPGEGDPAAIEERLERLAQRAHCILTHGAHHDR